MTSLTLIIGIVVLLLLSTLKNKPKNKNKRDFHNKSKPISHKKQIRESLKRYSNDRVFELGGYGIKYATNRSEKFFEPDFLESSLITNDPRGIFGESAMLALTARVCDTDKRHHILMRNLYIPTRKGTTEIDALLLHQSGIYVLESKNLSGEIYGDLENDQWIQILNKRTSHNFHNPIRQNIGHILALSNYLNIRNKQAHFISIIAFSDRCTFKSVPQDNKYWSIVHCSELKNKLLNIIQKRKNVYTTNQLEQMFRQLQSCINVSEQVKEEHLQYIQNKYHP